MRAWLLFTALGVLLAAPAVARDPMPLHPAPLATLSPPFTDGQGRERSLEEWRGMVVLLNVWATWCVSCREEMPRLDTVQARLGGPEFEVIALSTDGAGLERVRRFYDEIGIAHLGIYNEATMRASWAVGAIGLPTTILIDREGREIARLIGPAVWDRPESIAFFASIIASTGTDR